MPLPNNVGSAEIVSLFGPAEPRYLRLPIAPRLGLTAAGAEGPWWLPLARRPGERGHGCADEAGLDQALRGDRRGRRRLPPMRHLTPDLAQVVAPLPSRRHGRPGGTADPAAAARAQARPQAAARRAHPHPRAPLLPGHPAQGAGPSRSEPAEPAEA